MWGVCSIICVVVTAALCQGADIRLPPTIITSPIALGTFRPDQPIVLECEGSGVGTLTYTWIKNSVEMNLNDHARLNIEKGGAKVTINSGGINDEGFYQCIVSGPYGKAMSNTSFQQRAVMDTSSSKAIHNETVQIGSSFKIIAQAQKSHPKPTYSWEVAKTVEDEFPMKLTFTSRIQMDDNGDLHFAYAIPEDSQNEMIYKLVTSNQYLDQKQGGSYTRVFLNGKPADVRLFAPSQLFPYQKSYTAVVGRKISLRCFFAANPPARYVWSRTPGQIHPGRMEYSNDDTVLTINDVDMGDGGDYICQARNMEGSSSQTLHLLIHEASIFRTPSNGPRNKNSTEGETVSFPCNASGTPEPTVKWYMNGQLLSPDNLQQPRMRIINQNKVLTIEKVCRDCHSSEGRATDLMVIQCNSSNEHGYVLGTGYLNVLKKTQVILLTEDRKVTVKQDQAHSITFQCAIAELDPSTPAEITWYKVRQDDDGKVYDDLVIPSIYHESTVGPNGELTIDITQNKTSEWALYNGDYKCVLDNHYSKDFVTVTIEVEDLPPPVSAKQSGFADLWWIFIIIAVIMLLLILILCCCIYMQRNKGDSYPVDEKERKNHNNPEEELQANEFQEYTRPESRPLKGSRGSLGSSPKLDSDDGGSLNDYADVDPGKFTEDGSFVGAYINTNDRKK